MIIYSVKIKLKQLPAKSIERESYGQKKLL